jgi:rRNA maturation endonuclease Nob1
MEKSSSNKTIKCNNCNAEVPLGTSFCTECGKPVENISEINENRLDQNVVCPKCHVEISADLKFCEKCGTKIEHINTSNQQTTCPKCFSDVATEEKFCTVCGSSLEVKKNDSSANNGYEQTLDSVVESGKGLMNGLGGFLNKAVTEIDNNLNHSGMSGNRSSKSINKMLQERRENEKTVPGFLVCDKCDGYYELQSNESPDDFSDECECGGRLKHQKTIT